MLEQKERRSSSRGKDREMEDGEMEDRGMEDRGMGNLNPTQTRLTKNTDGYGRFFSN